MVEIGERCAGRALLSVLAHTWLRVSVSDNYSLSHRYATINKQPDISAMTLRVFRLFRSFAASI